MEKSFSISGVLSESYDLVVKNVGFIILTPIVYSIALRIVGSSGTSELTNVYVQSFPQLMAGTLTSQDLAEMVNDAELAMLVSPSFYLSLFAGILLQIFYQVGYSRFMLQSIDSKPLEAKGFLDKLDTYVNFALLSILLAVIVCVGCVFCILPGIYLAVRLGFAPLYVIDRHMNPMEALKACWNDMQGNWWKVFGANLLFILINIGGFCLCCVGMLFTQPFTTMAGTVVYRIVSGGSVANETISVDSYQK